MRNSCPSSWTSPFPFRHFVCVGLSSPMSVVVGRNEDQSAPLLRWQPFPYLYQDNHTSETHSSRDYDSCSDSRRPPQARTRG